MVLTSAVLAEEHDHPELMERWREGVGPALRTIVSTAAES
jgi:hypothetical protein